MGEDPRVDTKNAARTHLRRLNAMDFMTQDIYLNA
jgi:hypothetical protein